MSWNPECEIFYIFLEDLRQSGITNMYAASPYLVKHYDLDRKKAREVLRSWMTNYIQLKQDGVI